jgi:hypothetical protein
VGFVRVAADWVWDRLDDFSRPAPLRSGVVGLAVDFDKLGGFAVVFSDTQLTRAIRRFRLLAVMPPEFALLTAGTEDTP